MTYRPHPAALTAAEATTNATANAATFGITAGSRQPAEPTHQGPHPEYGHLETHRGRREDCTGPDCGPDDEEQPEQPEPFIPRTEREYWQAIADALNAANAVGMPVGIDLDGTLTDHHAHSVIWNFEDERWDVAGYDDEDQEQPAEPEPFARVTLRLADTDAGITVEAESHGMNPAATAYGLRNVADEFDNRARAQGIAPMPDRADHAVRLYATTAIEREDALADAAQLRARVAELEKRDAWLSILEAAGVDSWSGMEHAISMRNDAQSEQPAPPTAGDRYVKRTAPDTGRIVTVSRVWESKPGRTAVAYDWTDDKPGRAGSACPLDVFRRTYRPEAGR